MKCPKCIEEGLTSRVYPRGGMRTAMGWQPFYDEQGLYHNHDPNYTMMGYDCSNGHRWEQRENTPCPNCDIEKTAQGDNA